MLDIMDIIGVKFSNNIVFESDDVLMLLFRVGFRIPADGSGYKGNCKFLYESSK